MKDLKETLRQYSFIPDEELTEVIIAMRKSLEAFWNLLKKLEDDKYIKSEKDISPIVSINILNELAAFVLIKSDNAGEKFEIYKQLVAYINSEYYDYRIVDSYIDAINAQEVSDLEGYKIIEKFDMMAQEFDGAFWSRMHVDNPGNISGLYLNLYDGYSCIGNILFGKGI